MITRILSVLLLVVFTAACASNTYDDANIGASGKPMLDGAAGGGSDVNVSDYGTDLNAGSAALQAQLEREVGAKVHFAFDSSAIDTTARETLRKQADWLKKYSSLTVTVEGHCDERGTREYNLALGERRATAVKNFLVSQGISSSRISTVSYGKERPAVLGSNAEAWAQNRRGVTVID